VALELEQLEVLLQGVILDTSPGMCTSYFEDDSHRMLFCIISKSSTHDDCTCIEFVWRNSSLS
jgi:hypothetical protein